MAQVTFQSNLGKFDKATKEQLAKAAEIIGGMAESFAKELCPVDTGNLRNSITHATEDEGHTVVIGTNVTYAPYVELGHRQQVGRYVPAIKKRLVRDWVNPKPYLRPAIENHIDEYKDVVQMVLSD